MRVVVSMTTVPWRLNLLRPMLESVKSQGGYDRFVINIPRRCARNDESYVIPEWMEELVEVNQCEDDLGPAMKLLPILQSETDPETLIVTADDDVLYGEDWLLDLKGWADNIRGSALGYVGASFSDGHFVHGEMVHSPVRVQVLGGYRGVAYRRRLFEDDVHEAMAELLKGGICLVDDHFFASYLANKRVSRVVLPCRPNYRFMNLDGGIYDGNSQAGESNRRLKEAMKRWEWSM